MDKRGPNTYTYVTREKVNKLIETLFAFNFFLSLIKHDPRMLTFNSH